MNGDIKNRRRNYFIDKSFQAKFIIKFCFLIILAGLLTGALIYLFSSQSTTVAFENLRVVVKSTADFIMPITLEILVIVTLFVGVATIAVTLFASHKIAGPLYKLNMELTKIKAGDLSSPIRIRAKDQLQKFAKEFDDMRVELKSSIKELGTNWVEVKSDLEKIQSTISGEEKNRITDYIKKIDSVLTRFKID